jgi:GAF domain-containing protein
MTAPTFHTLAGSTGPGAVNLGAQLNSVHTAIGARYPGIERLALAAYDPLTDELKTFVSSNQDGAHLDHYAAQLQNVPSLQMLAKQRMSRVVDDIDDDLVHDTRHTDWLKSRAYRSSLTVPIFNADSLAGFLFFDSKVPHYFDEEVAGFLEVFAQLIAQLYLLQLKIVNGMVGTVQLASTWSAWRPIRD